MAKAKETPKYELEVGDIVNNPQGEFCEVIEVLQKTAYRDDNGYLWDYNEETNLVCKAKDRKDKWKSPPI